MFPSTRALITLTIMLGITPLGDKLHKQRDRTVNFMDKGVLSGVRLINNTSKLIGFCA